MPRRAAVDHGDTPNENEREIARRFVEGQTTRQIGREMQLDHGSVARIIRRDRVTRLVTELQEEAVDALKRRFAAAAAEAFDVLREIAGDREAPAAARVSAAKEVLVRVVPPRTAIEGGERPVQVTVGRDLSMLPDAELRRIAGIPDDAGA